ncbi:hypothetical protein BDW68DRAFT_153075 [Aspergillus falconensis]
MVAARRVHLEPLLSSVLETPSILGRLAQLKLKEETSSVEPSLRRCLGHRHVFNKCVTATSQGTITYPARNTTRPQPGFGIDPKPASPKTQAQITNIVKGIVHRRLSPEPCPESDELRRVQARGAAGPSSTESRTDDAAPRIFLGLNPFARFKQRKLGKSLG